MSGNRHFYHDTVNENGPEMNEGIEFRQNSRGIPVTGYSNEGLQEMFESSG